MNAETKKIIDRIKAQHKDVNGPSKMTEALKLMSEIERKVKIEEEIENDPIKKMMHDMGYEIPVKFLKLLEVLTSVKKNL